MEKKKSSGTVNETDKQNSTSNQLVEKIEIENTPFTAVRIDDKWFLTMGKYRLTPPLPNKKEALAAGVDESWWRIMQVVNVMINEHEKENGKFDEGTKLNGTLLTETKTKL